MNGRVKRTEAASPFFSIAASLTLTFAIACGGAADAPPAPETSGVPEASAGTVAFAPTPDGARLHTESLGEGRPIVVVHGGPGMDSRYLRRGLEPLKEFGRVVFYDQRGTGRSEGWDPALATFDAFVDDIEAVRTSTGADRITVLGHSFGALLAIEYTHRYPEHVAALVLVDPSEPGSRYLQQANAQREGRLRPEDAATLQELASSGALSAGDTAAFRQFYEAAFRASFADPARMVDLDLSMQEATASRGLQVIQGVGGSTDLSDGWQRLSQIDVPTLLVQGEADLLPVEMALEMADSLPRSRIGTVPDAGHFPWVEQPAAFFDLLRGWEGWR